MPATILGETREKVERNSAVSGVDRVEAMDIVFAIDSVPAVLAITRDTFIVYSSNAFAILGLRALYFALADILPRFRFLHQGLAAILLFVERR